MRSRRLFRLCSLLLPVLGCAVGEEVRLTPQVRVGWGPYAPSSQGGKCAASPAIGRYLGAAREQIAAHWQPPSDMSLTIVAHFRIAEDGEIHDINVMESGRPQAQQQALAALSSASPLPPLPADARCLEIDRLMAEFGLAPEDDQPSANPRARAKRG